MNSLRYFDFGAARPVLLLIARIAVVLIFIIFGFPKMMGFDGTVQYMASLGAPMPMLAAIIAVVMEVPAAILIVLGFFTIDHMFNGIIEQNAHTSLLMAL